MNINELKKILIFICLLMAVITSSVNAQTPAFPGAEGFGKYTTGGRGGKVYHVTKLTDGTEEGTLRYAVNQSGARTIVFDVSGVIELESQLTIKNGDLTIAGQTAPGDGICIKNHTVYVGADNVIMRFLRFRLGTDDPDGYNDDGTPYQDRDAIWGRNQSDIIIDHCSMSWCTDECGSFYNNKNFTMQWCLLAESLRGSIHPKGYHGFGGIWGGQGASFHHNMLAHHSSRNPRMCGSRYTNEADKELVDLRNNVFYNWGYNSGYAAEGGNYNFVNNYYKSGPETSSNVKYRIFEPYADDGSNSQTAGIHGYFYVNGNYMDGKGSNWDWDGIDVNNGNNSSMTKETIKKTTEFAAESVTTHTAEAAFNKVIKLAGASLRRDAVDARVASEAQNGTYTYTGSVLGGKGIIDKTSDVGGWPVYASTTTPTDSDQDGMPDEWETANGLNPNDASDGAAKATDNTGYTNLENYMNSLVCEIMAEGLSDAQTTSDYTCPEQPADSAKISKRGAGSSNQVLTKGAVLTPFYYVWENATTVAVEGDIPNGVEYEIDLENKTISFSGAALDEVGKYSAKVKTVGGVGEAYYNISFTIEASSYVVTKRKFDFVVGIDGDFKAAVEAAKASSSDRFYIFFPNGSYDIGSLTGDDNQKTTYSRAKTSFIGQSMDNVIVYNKATNEGISISATLYLDSNADETYMQDITLQNKASYVVGAAANRFVALQDRGNKNIYKRVKLLSTQDTYYSTAYEDKSYWEEGEIHGTVDFICGGGDILFNQCLIYLEERANNVIAAPANAGDWGYVFKNCTIDGHSVNAGGYRLGRPWNNKASAVYINTTMNLLPTAAGWGDPMNVVPTRFAEYKSVDANGNAVDLSQRRTTYTKNETTVTLNPVLSDSEAAQFTESNILGGWNASNDCKQISAPIVEVENGVMTWFDNDSALCYFIFKNDIYVTNITESEYTIPNEASEGDLYTVRAANAMGGLGASSNAVSKKGVQEPFEADFYFYYENGVTSSPNNDDINSRWDCTDSRAEGYGWAITGRTDKAVLYGADITYEGSTYKTFKNSRGAQATFYLPTGMAAKSIRFIGYSNGETPAELTEIGGESVSYSLGTTTATADYANNPAVITYTFAEQKCDSFTYTFSTTQVCFIIALQVEACEQTTSIKEVLQTNENLNGPIYDVLGRRVDRLELGKVYIQNGIRFMMTE